MKQTTAGRRRSKPQIDAFSIFPDLTLNLLHAQWMKKRWNVISSLFSGKRISIHEAIGHLLELDVSGVPFVHRLMLALRPPLTRHFAPTPELFVPDDRWDDKHRRALLERYARFMNPEEAERGLVADVFAKGGGIIWHLGSHEGADPRLRELLSDDCAILVPVAGLDDRSRPATRTKVGLCALFLNPACLIPSWGITTAKRKKLSADSVSTELGSGLLDFARLVVHDLLFWHILHATPEAEAVDEDNTGCTEGQAQDEHSCGKRFPTLVEHADTRWEKIGEHLLAHPGETEAEE